MRKLGGVVAVATAVLVLAISPNQADAAEPGIEADFVSAVNRERADAGLPALRVHDELTSVARRWADRMASANEIWHNPDLSSQVTAPWVVLGENVGTGYDVPTLMQAFVDSASHYRNLVDARYEWVGIGVTRGSDGRLYTAHVFMDLDAAAAPAPVPAAAPATTAPAPAAAPPPAAPAPPPAAAEPERVQTVLTAVAAIGVDGVA